MKNRSILNLDVLESDRPAVELAMAKTGYRFGVVKVIVTVPRNGDVTTARYQFYDVTSPDLSFESALQASATNYSKSWTAGLGFKAGAVRFQVDANGKSCLSPVNVPLALVPRLSTLPAAVSGVKGRSSAARHEHGSLTSFD